MENKYKLKIIIEDWDSQLSYTKEYNDEKPTINDFINFCYNAGKAYGFDDEILKTVINCNNS